MNPASGLVRGLILGYRHVVSPFLPGSCRYHPSCSAYALQAVARFGAVRGGWLALKRVLRCNPWGGWGYDPVPERDADAHRYRHGRHCSPSP